MLVICAVTTFAISEALTAGRIVSARFKQLTRASNWQLVSSLALPFNTHHPQGLVKVGDNFYLSSVEVTQPPQRFAQPQDGFDRDTGAGLGHLFKFDLQGKLLADLTLGEGAVYHPGGIDFDGRFIWVPVAEYRPNSRSIIYRVDPTTMKATEVLRYADHLGGIVHNTDNHSLHAISWGSRFFYSWKLDAQGRVKPATQLRAPNHSFFIDYQDCKYLGKNEMLCGGLSNYQVGKAKFSLGGLELVDLTGNRAIHQVPLERWTDSGLPMTQNPFWLEPTERGLRAYCLPADHNSTLYVFAVNTQ